VEFIDSLNFEENRSKNRLIKKIIEMYILIGIYAVFMVMCLMCSILSKMYKKSKNLPSMSGRKTGKTVYVKSVY
jgi:hypothetical protein